jgi:hypothetical protein
MSLEELLHNYYANLLYLKWQHPKHLPTLFHRKRGEPAAEPDPSPWVHEL